MSKAKGERCRKFTRGFVDGREREGELYGERRHLSFSFTSLLRHVGTLRFEDTPPPLQRFRGFGCGKLVPFEFRVIIPGHARRQKERRSRIRPSCAPPPPPPRPPPPFPPRPLSPSLPPRPAGILANVRALHAGDLRRSLTIRASDF